MHLNFILKSHYTKKLYCAHPLNLISEMDIDILLLKRYTTLKIDNSFIYIQYNETIIVFIKFFNSVGNGRTNQRHLD